MDSQQDLELLRSLLPKKKQIKSKVLLKPLRDERRPDLSFINHDQYVSIVTKVHKRLEEMAIGGKFSRGPFLASVGKLRARATAC